MYGDLEACCGCRDVEEAQRFGALEMRCSLTYYYGDLELWRHAAGVASKEVWSSSVLFVVVGISSFRSSVVPPLR